MNPDNNDKKSLNLRNTRTRVSIHHSDVSEHFNENYPLFINRWEEGFELKQHDHAYIEMVYVLSGEGFHYVGDHVEKVAKGSLYVLPIGTSHVLRPSSLSSKSKLIVFNLCIRQEFVEELNTWLTRVGHEEEAETILNLESGTCYSLVDKSMELVGLFEEIYREFKAMPQGYTLNLFGCVMQLLARMIRLLGHEAPPNYRRWGANVNSILNYIDNHFTERITIESLANQFGMSCRHLIRSFQSATAMTFTNYLQHKRVDYACRLLLETDDKISYIARSVGYSDISHFRTVFHRIMGTSPTKYRLGK